MKYGFQNVSIYQKVTGSISLTGIAKYKSSDEPRIVISNWMSSYATIDVLTMWESLYNPGFNRMEYQTVRSETGRLIMTPSLNMLAEATTTELTKIQNPQGLEENQEVAREGGSIAGNARKEIEDRTGRPVITSQNAKQLNEVVVELIEGVSELEKD